MNTQEHLLVCCEEEALEVARAALDVAKACSKGLRFGIKDSTTEALRDEFNDLLGAVELLMEKGVYLPGLFSREAINAKKVKIVENMKLAEADGALQTDQAR